MFLELKVFGVTVKLEFTFLLTIAFVLSAGFDDALFVILFSALHELGHLAVLYLCGGKADRLTFAFYGFGLSYSSKLSRSREAVVLLAGPAANLLLWLFLRDPVNLILFVLNILPVFPLDGGRILRLYCPEKLFILISSIFLALLLLLSFYLLVAYKVFTLLFIVLYLVISNLRYL